MTALVIAEHDKSHLRGGTHNAITAAAKMGGDVHVLVAGGEGGATPTSLAARRAATLRAYLEQRGVPATRLRAEGRAAAADPRVLLVLKPVVAGREPEAWTPPS